MRTVIFIGLLTIADAIKTQTFGDISPIMLCVVICMDIVDFFRGTKC